MTRTRRKYQNRKRVVHDVDDQEGEKDAIVQHGKIDSNVDVLPGKKKEKNKKQKEPNEKRLTRKERKKLEQIVKRKAVKQQRSEIIDALQKVQASVDQTRFLVSTTSVYNGGEVSQVSVPSKDEESTVRFPSTSLRGANKQKKRQCSESESDTDSVSTNEMSTDSEIEREVDELDRRGDCQNREEVNKVNDVQPVAAPVAEIQPPSSKVIDASPANIEPEVTDAANEEKAASSSVDEQAMKRIRPQFNVPVTRTEAVENSRKRLPIVGEEHTVMEAINASRVTIVCGETGSGKTTQVPQFLYEAGYASGAYRIAVTEPRRIAAISMSKRVAEELNGDPGLVGYRIRYDSNVTPATRLIFMTDGVLLKEVQKDFLLRDYSVVVLDEVHERSVFTDILIGLLSRIVRVREKRGEPLKLVLMSATLRVSDFTDNRRLFAEPPPTINIATRQYPVTVHFNRATPPRAAYVEAAFRKVIKVHATLPEGGVLVFVATANDVRAVCALLRKANDQALARRQRDEKQAGTSTDAGGQQTQATGGEVDLECVSAFPSKAAESESQQEGNQMDTDATADAEDGGEEDPDAEERWLVKNAVFGEPMHVLPLYSLLPTAEQLRVFEPPPANTRLVVVATNVAETSLTIPGIRYVVDSGLVKRKYYEKTLGISQFRIEWCSKASANQRAGRAGRVGPGHAYRLYSSAVFSDFAEFGDPEIMERPLDDIVLQTKSLGIDNIENFPFPNAPSAEALREAERVLLALGAVKRVDGKSLGDAQTLPKLHSAAITRISELGERLAKFSVSPRCAKLLVLATQFDILDYAVLLVAAMSVPELLLEVPPAGSTSHTVASLVSLRRSMLNTTEWRRLGDFGVLIKTIAAVEFALRRNSSLRTAVSLASHRVEEVCAQFGVRTKAFRELMKLRAQLRSQVDAVLGEVNQAVRKVSVDLEGHYVDASSYNDTEPLAPPTEQQLNCIRQCIVCVLCDHVLRRLTASSAVNEAGTSGSKKSGLSNEPRYEHMIMNDPVLVHPNSALHGELIAAHRSGRAGAEYSYLLFGELQQNQKQNVYAKPVCVVDVDWLHRLCEPFCEFGSSSELHPVRYEAARDVVMCRRPVTYGAKSWQLGDYDLPFPDGAERVKQFARLLVEGEIYDSLKRFVPSLLFSPSVLVRSWCGLHSRAAELVNRLVAADNVDNREKLEAQWRANRNFLLEEYVGWLPQALYYQVRDVWPPCEAT